MASTLLRDPQALSSTLAFARDTTAQGLGSLTMRRDLAFSGL